MDIVKRLRDTADFSVAFSPPSDWLHEAADEIERLREALHTIVATRSVNEINPQAHPKMMWIGCTQIAEAALKRDHFADVGKMVEIELKGNE